MKRVATLVCASLLGVACGAEAGTSPAPATTEAAAGRLVLTERHHGRTVTMRLGRTGKLLVPSRLRGPVRSVGKSVLSIRVESFAPTDTQEWELRAVRAGTTVITGPRRDGSRFRITIRVVR
jgi:hypothetical protein